MPTDQASASDGVNYVQDGATGVEGEQLLIRREDAGLVFLGRY